MLISDPYSSSNLCDCCMELALQVQSMVFCPFGVRSEVSCIHALMFLCSNSRMFMYLNIVWPLATAILPKEKFLRRKESIISLVWCVGYVNVIRFSNCVLYKPFRRI